MKKALVLGASGGMGYSIVNELISRELHVVAFARTRSKLEKLFQNQQGITIFTGDIFNLDDLLRAATDVDVIFSSSKYSISRMGRKACYVYSTSYQRFGDRGELS